MSWRAAAPEKATSDSKPRLRSVRCMTLASASSSSTMRVRSGPSAEGTPESVESEGHAARDAACPEAKSVQLPRSRCSLATVSLEVQSRQTDAGVTVLAPSGRLDVTGAPMLKDAISEAVKNGQPRLVIDMEGVSFVDSTGLGSVIAALKLVRSSKGDLRLAAPNQQVRVVLELTTLDRVFPYFATVEDALADF